MSKNRSAYACTECGWTTVKWVGRCGECQAWGTVTESGPAPSRAVKPAAPVTRAQPIGDVPSAASKYRATGIGEVDRVLGGGVVPGSVILLAGEPGVGKSTLEIVIASCWDRVF